VRTEDHFLIRFAEERIPTCPYCKRDGKFSGLIWDLHPKDRSSQNIDDQVLGCCRNGHDIFIGVDAIAWPLGDQCDDEKRERVDCWGKFEKDDKK
jgi:hypothetical protein